MPKNMSRSKIEQSSIRVANPALSRPAVPQGVLFPALASLLLLALTAFLVFQPSLRMLRLWVNHDEFERHKLSFSIGGVPAEWGYACWTEKPGETFQNLPPALDHNIAGGPLVINGSTFQTGIGGHAPSKIAFSLEGKYSHFSCLAGLDATSANSYGVIYSVLADGREIFRSPKLKSDANPLTIDLSVSGVKELVLYADPTEFINTNSNIDWVNLKFDQ